MKAKAVVEVTVVFGLTLSLVALAGLSPVGSLVRQATGRPCVEYLVMIAVPPIIPLASRRDLASYGPSFRNPRYHLDVAATALVPVALASMPFMSSAQRVGTGHSS